MYAVEFAPETATSHPGTAVPTTTGRDTASDRHQTPTPGDVIDAWARHVGASNGFGDAATGDGQRPFVLPYWKSR
jgi:hypothetical protein